jgi:hypothetical protein
LAGSSAEQLACFAGIDESEFGSMDALDKQVGWLEIMQTAWHLM